MNLFKLYSKELGMEQRDIKTISPNTLAYIGDSVYDLFVRYYLINKSQARPNAYNQEAVNYVSALGQEKFFMRIKAYLTEDELKVYKRGKNAKHKKFPQSASRETYCLATGVESLLGYLLLTEKYDRLAELMARGVRQNEE